MTSTPVKAFMDDMFLMSPSIPATQVLLDRCAVALIWARMSFRASKSRSMVIDKGKVIDISPFSFKGEIIPPIHANPVRFLSRTIDFTVSDKHSVEKFVTEVLSGLTLIDKSSHKGIHKVWILQKYVNTKTSLACTNRLPWPVLIYEISISVVDCLEHKISSFLRKLLNIHHCTRDICLYSSTSSSPLPLKCLTLILKSTKVSGHLLLRDSADKQISESVSQLPCGFWDVAEAVVDAESRLEFHKVTGYHQTSRAGFRSFKSPSILRRNSHRYRKLVSHLVGEVDENAYYAKSVQLHLQGYWTKWCDFVKNDLSWKTLLAMPSSLISFCLGATFDTLPCPSNLKCWRVITELSCFLCGKRLMFVRFY